MVANQAREAVAGSTSGEREYNSDGLLAKLSQSLVRQYSGGDTKHGAAQERSAFHEILPRVLCFLINIEYYT
jgi:hypothetical protein